MAAVLLIDDSNTIRKTGDLLLQRMGHRVCTAKNGMEAICLLAEGGYIPDVVFVDITMPRINGRTFCSLVHANKRFRHIPLVVLSSHDTLADQAKSAITGAFMHVNKPFTAEDLETAISACLARKPLGNTA